MANEQEIQRCKYQRFEVMDIRRSQIKEAPYNPRYMDEQSDKTLRKILKKKGLVEPLVWNKRTGILVGGHQRLRNLDKAERYNPETHENDYLITVSAVDVDEKEERELNIILNNQNLAGSYDLTKIGDLLLKDGINFAEVGFNAFDIAANFDSPVADAILGTKFDEEDEQVKADIEEIKKIKEKRKAAKDKANGKNSPDFFKVIVFNSQAESDAFCDFFGFDVLQRHVDGEAVNAFLKIGEFEPEEEDLP